MMVRPAVLFVVPGATQRSHMQLELSPADAELRDRLREFFTTNVPQEIRDAVLGGRLGDHDRVEALG